MSTLLFFIFVLASIPLTLASPLPREVPFFIAFVSLWMIPRSGSIGLALIAGVLVDLFSPIKGLSAILYPLVLLLIIHLEQTVLVHRSLPAFLVLASIAWLCIVAIKFIVSGTFFYASLDMLLTYVRAGLINMLFFIVLYGIVRIVVPARL
ncbi:MAG: hypothetical protein AAB855_01280 [Patescibacteria group bacterium]